MTNELNARAAEIMGWKESLKHRVARDYNWVAYEDPETGMKVCNQEDWNPCENIAQAFELAHEMCEDYELKYNGDIYDFTIAGVLRRGDSLPDTITRACVAAAERK